jgi:hypothetical protein
MKLCNDPCNDEPPPPPPPDDVMDAFRVIFSLKERRGFLTASTADFLTHTLVPFVLFPEDIIRLLTLVVFSRYDGQLVSKEEAIVDGFSIVFSLPFGVAGGVVGSSNKRV